ncbi:retinaldehyde-binding protein 1-like [Hydra vulgaris]|uniref:Retinaldehyde-binding protein 1-like n=1 Tax=Hydra vulgaris TaxID=6087 RepID=A0ABM4BWP2_HYDVU
METISELDIFEPNGPILGGNGYIPAQTQRKAYQDLYETPQTKIACIRSLRNLIEEKQEENNFDEHSDAFLLKFLRHRKFDVNDAYHLLERYYTNREAKPEIFRNLTRKNIRKTLEQGIVCVLPQRDQHGRVLINFDLRKWDFSVPWHFDKLLRVWVYTLTKLFEVDETQINGIVIICDLRQLSVLQTKSLRSSMLKKVIDLFQDNFPFRLNAVHLLNPSWHFKLLWKMINVSAFIKPKLAERLFVHDGDLSIFNNEFPVKYLPKELGGEVVYDNNIWVKELLEPEKSEQVTQLQTSAHIQALNKKKKFSFSGTKRSTASYNTAKKI